MLSCHNRWAQICDLGENMNVPELVQEDPGSIPERQGMLISRRRVVLITSFMTCPMQDDGNLTNS